MLASLTAQEPTRSEASNQQSEPEEDGDPRVVFSKLRFASVGKGAADLRNFNSVDAAEQCRGLDHRSPAGLP